MTISQNAGFLLIRDRIAFYRKHSEDWKGDHKEAMACFELEELLALGIDAFKAINRADEWVRAQVVSGEAEYDVGEFEKVEVLYQQWMQCSIVVNDILSRFEKNDFDVRGADDFRRCYREVQGILTPDEKFFAHDSLVRLRDEAIDAHRRRETVEIKELSD